MRREAAEHRIQMRSRIEVNKVDEAMRRYAQVERKVDEMEAYADLINVGERGLEAQFQELAAEESIEKELAELKRRRSGGSAPTPAPRRAAGRAEGEGVVMAIGSRSRDGPGFVTIVSLFVVLPWMILHYISKSRASRNLTEDDERMLEDLWRSARTMERRIETLERLIEPDAQPARPRPSAEHPRGHQLMVDDYTYSPNPKRLYRSRDKVIAGVCGGLADRMGWDPPLVRIAFAVLFFTGVLSASSPVYIVIWAITPVAPYRAAQPLSRRRALLALGVGPAGRDVLEHPLQVQGHGRPPGADGTLGDFGRMETEARIPRPREFLIDSDGAASSSRRPPEPNIGTKQPRLSPKTKEGHHGSRPSDQTCLCRGPARDWNDSGDCRRPARRRPPQRRRHEDRPRQGLGGLTMEIASRTCPPNCGFDVNWRPLVR